MILLLVLNPIDCHLNPERLLLDAPDPPFGFFDTPAHFLNLLLQPGLFPLLLADPVEQLSVSLRDRPLEGRR